MLSAILIDDEVNCLESLCLELENYCPDIHVIGTFNDPIEGRNAISDLHPDLVFLDIEMPHLNGFELLESLSIIDFHVIFVTAYDEFALRAFQFDAIDYLLKPIQVSKLIEAVKRAFHRNFKLLNHNSLSALINNIYSVTKNLESIALPIPDGYEFVEVNAIMYVKADSNYSWIHLEKDKSYLLAKTLKQVERVLAHLQFFRSHHSWLVNLNHVKKYIRGQGGYLIMKDGTQIPVSRVNKETLVGMLRF